MDNRAFSLIPPQESDYSITIFDGLTFAETNPPLDPTKVNKVFDHHPANRGRRPFPNANIKIEDLGAISTLVAERIFRHTNLTLPKEIAIVLLAGIVSNTQGLHGSITRPRDETAAAKLALIAEVNIDNFYAEMVREMSKIDPGTLSEDIQLTIKEPLIIGDKKFIIAQFEGKGWAASVEQYQEEIVHVLASIKQENQADAVFLSCFEMPLTANDKSMNYFVTASAKEDTILEQTLNAQKEGKLLKLEPGLLRKQIVPLLQQNAATIAAILNG